MVEAVVRRGVTPFPVTIFGDTVPDHKITWAPVGGVALEAAVAKKVTVPEPPVPAGKSILATGVTVPADSAHPPEALVTLTLV